MDVWNLAGAEPIFQVHEAGDGEPALDAGRTVQERGGASDFKLADPEVESRAEEEIQEQEGGLESAAAEMGVVVVATAEELLFELRLRHVRLGIFLLKRVGWIG